MVVQEESKKEEDISIMAKILKLEMASVAQKIGAVYRRGREAFLEVGKMLIAEQAGMGHGEWKPWLEANQEILGFGRRTAFRLMALAKSDAGDTFDLWGHESRRDSELIQQSLSNEHYTPEKYIEAARLVLGEIDLDPASCEEANKVIKAIKFFNEKQNGLMKSWNGRVWLNPPYGEWAAEFVEKLQKEMKTGNVTAAIVLVNAHCTDTAWFNALWDGVLCFTDHRINFYGDEKRSGSTHGSVFVYFGNNKARFNEVFSRFGAVVVRMQ